MGWGGRLDGPGQQGVMGQRWWVAWEEGGAGVNIVMISPEFRSSRPMRRERAREREREQLLSCHHWQVHLWCHLLHLLLLLFILKTTKKREGWCKKIEMLTHTHAHTHERQTTSAGSSHRPIRVLTERREEESFLCQTLFYLKCSCFSRFFPLVVLSEKLLVVRTIL